MKRILLCQHVDGETKPTIDGIALILGVNPDHLREVWDPASGPSTIPTDLKRKGTKRARTARDAMGDNSISVGLGYWAVAQWGARIDIDHDSGSLWAVVDT